MKAAFALLLVGLAAVSGLPKELPSPTSTGWERIVGGEEATPYEFPWMVDMRVGGHYCGGSVVSADWVVTAAHCVGGSPSNYELVAGDHNIVNNTEGNEQRRRVTRIIRHPAYGSGAQYSSDIALMQVDSPFVLNQFVQPVALAPSGFLPTERAIVAGWGALTEGGSSPVVLYKVDVPMVNDTACRAAYGEAAISDDMICSGEGGKDSCQGDSGGPKMCPRNNVLYLCGIVSWGRGCAREGFPGVYTEVSYFEPWVRTAILPPVESNDTWVETRNCGGVLAGSSGYINYKLGQPYIQNETCTWTLQASDRENIRVRVRGSGLASDASVSVTEVDFSGALVTTTTRLTDLSNQTFSGPIVFITFKAGVLDGTGFDFDFYGTNYDFSTGLQFSNAFYGASTGSASFPAGGGQYVNNAFATLVVNPTPSTNSSAVARLSFDSINVEGSVGSCSYDWVQVNALSNGQFQPVGVRNCGTVPPSQRFESDQGVLILIFRTDSSVTGTGFTFTWNDQ